MMMNERGPNLATTPAIGRFTKEYALVPSVLELELPIVGAQLVGDNKIHGVEIIFWDV